MTNISPNITHSHDKFFKTVFSKKEAVAEFIEKLLPKGISKHIDLDSLVLDNTEYTDEQLKTHCSDVVYNCNYISDEVGEKRSKAIPIKISLLFEHKSYPEKYPHLQLMRYFLNMWEMQIKQKQKLTPVIPIIFYHGRNKWNKQPLTDYFVDLDDNLDDNLKQFLPNFDYLLLDTNQYDDEDFQHLDVAELQYSILTMKYIFSMEQLQNNLETIFRDIEQILENEDGRKFFQTLVIYLFQHSYLNAQQWREKMHTISPKVERHFVSTYDQAINAGMAKGKLEGIQEGMQKGIQEGMQKGKLEGIRNTAKNLKNMGLDLQIISKSTGLSLAEVKKL